MRRSCRTKTPSKYFVPEVQDTRQKRLGTARRAARKLGQPDVNQDGTPFCCDKCGSNYIVKPGRCLTSKGHAAAPKRKRVFGIRYKTDPETKKRLTLCNACGIRFDRQEKNQDRYKVPKATDQDKLKYLEEAKRFASSLVEGLKDPDADRLACLHISSKPCGCMQRYIIAEGNMEKSRDRASILLKMIKDAKKLKEKKSYSIEELINKGKKFRKVGLGNGQKRSKEFEEFVLTNRQYLRNQLKFCERACQRILSYSNNFLHKKLKTEPERRERIERTKGKMALGLLKDITELSDIKCCEAECSLMAQSHAVLLKTWRERANSGQAEARKVLAEMLTPSGKVSNCANFITLVTGCSLSTIQSVATQMRETGGDREPPAHGLKRYWKNHPRRQRSLSELEQDVLGTRESQPVAQKASTDRTTSTEGGGGGDNNSAATDIETPALTATQLREQQNQLKRLQQHLDEQQRRISQQQSVIEQQLQQHKLAMQQKRLQQKQRQQQQQLQQEQQQQQLSETQQQEIIQAQQQATSEEVGSQSTARQQAETQQASTQQQQQQVAQLVAQQQLLLHQLGAQQIAQQLVAQQQQVASTGTAVTVAQPSVAMEGMMDSRLLQQNTQQLLQEIPEPNQCAAEQHAPAAAGDAE
ncbi:plectin-like [Acanthaster planci]|uniref:Plectin-like n=1 Tax=Acanthaster planci TaxID=133434 RepID=A0A8B7YL55_ACAPL|nr:plectin-like [Acanthaster planci]